jgi:YesN/AraC family two-component response regulator
VLLEDEIMSNIAEKETDQMRMAGYHHMSREFEQYCLGLFLKGNLDFLDYLTSDLVNTYSLSSSPLRSLKNNIICIVTVLCRAVIDTGVDAEKCYALSDYYISELEELHDETGVLEHVKTLARHYSRLINEEKLGTYSLPVVRTIRYVRSHIYESFRVKDIANELKLHPNYLSSLFCRETGTALLTYIKQFKLDEAIHLLINGNYSITEISEMLGYSSVAYFSNDFKKITGQSPKSYTRSNKWTPAEALDIAQSERKYGLITNENIRNYIK